jgi:ABC-type Mn2+/Zn2+ transport system permease subunit
LYDWFVRPFSENTFMLHALAAGALVAIACAIVGTLVVLRGLAFIGDALAHGVLPGIAAAVLLGYPGILGATAGAAVMIGGVSLITQRSRLSSDTAIGLLFVGMLALGVVIVSRSNQFQGDLVRILFGELLGISSQAILVQTAATVAVGAVALICGRPFLLLCFDEEQAQVSGFSTKFYHFIMLVLIATTIVVSFQTVGTLLVFGMLLAPSSAAALLTNKLETMIAWSAAIGIGVVYCGLLCSYHFDTAAGGTIVFISTLVFFAVFVFRSLASSRFDRSPEAVR